MKFQELTKFISQNSFGPKIKQNPHFTRLWLGQEPYNFIFKDPDFCEPIFMIVATKNLEKKLYFGNAVMWLRLVQSIVFRSCKTTRSVARKKINCVLALTANAKVASYYHHGTSLKPKLHKCSMQKFDFRK